MAVGATAGNACPSLNVAHGRRVFWQMDIRAQEGQGRGLAELRVEQHYPRGLEREAGRRIQRQLARGACQRDFVCSCREDLVPCIVDRAKQWITLGRRLRCPRWC